MIKIKSNNIYNNENNNIEINCKEDIMSWKKGTITFDNGVEFHGYKKIEEVFPVICYFATPYHSWERGSNENANGLIRQYIPKKTSMKNLTQCN